MPKIFPRDPKTWPDYVNAFAKFFMLFIASLSIVGGLMALLQFQWTLAAWEIGIAVVIISVVYWKWDT